MGRGGSAPEGGTNQWFMVIHGKGKPLHEGTCPLIAMRMLQIKSHESTAISRAYIAHPAPHIATRSQTTV